MSDLPERNDRKTNIPEFSEPPEDPKNHVRKLGSWQCRTVIPEELWVDVGHYGKDAHEWARLDPDTPLHLSRTFTFDGDGWEVPNINITGFAPPALLTKHEIEHVFAENTPRENRRQLLHCCQMNDELDVLLEGWLEGQTHPLKLGKPFDLSFKHNIPLGNGRKIDFTFKATFETELVQFEDKQKFPFTRLKKLRVDLEHIPLHVKGAKSGHQSL